MNATQRIDIVLKTIVSLEKSGLKISEDLVLSELLYNNPNLKEEASHEKEFLRILNRLKSDGYIKSELFAYTTKNEEVIEDHEMVFLAITFDGFLFFEHGGYEGQLYRQNKERKRVEDLETNQKENANRMTYLTAVLAVFGLFSLFLQTLEKFNVIFRIHIWTAFFVFFVGMLSGISILLILHQLIKARKEK